MSNPYEQQGILNEYLSFHYRGDRSDYLPLHSVSPDALGYPVRCAERVLEHTAHRGRALDLGCAVGRSSFELSAEFDEVVGVDFSDQFIRKAQQIQAQQDVRWPETVEGDSTEVRGIAWNPDWKPHKVQFEVGDACDLRESIGTFDAVLMANLLCRLPDPGACLKRVQAILRPQGVLILTTPRSWDETYTVRERWMDDDSIAACLGELTCVEKSDLPFVIREHQRKAQFTVAQLSVWKKGD